MSSDISHTEVLLLRRISPSADNPPKPWRRRVCCGGATGFARGAPLDPATLNCGGQVLKTSGEERANNMVQDKVESLIVNTTFSPKDDIPCELLYLGQK